MPKLSVLLSTILFCCSAMAHASPVTYEFTISWDSGELAGSISRGEFSFDSSLEIPGARITALNLFTDFDLSVRNSHFTEETVSGGFIEFNDSGIRYFYLGNNCFVAGSDGSVGCSSNAGNRNEFIIRVTGSGAKSVIGDGPIDGQSNFSKGETTLRRITPQPNEIPEPYTPWLILTGLGLVSIARSKASSRLPPAGRRGAFPAPGRST